MGTTYKKRGNKIRNKQKEESIEDVDLSQLEQESTTAGVFNTLDETANKTEDWVIKNQKPIMMFIGAALFCLLAYFLYQKFYQAPNETKAANALAFPRKNFDKAVTGNETIADSLYVLALNGDMEQVGFVDVASNYSSTKAGNLANYYAGISYLKTKNYKEAISYLDKFSSDDQILAPLAKGAIGDAFSDLNQLEDAYEYYSTAANMRSNEFTTPLFLNKAGNLAISLGKNSDAQTMFERIQKEFPNSPEAKQVDSQINRAKYSK